MSYFGTRLGTTVGATIIPSSTTNYIPVSSANALTASLLNSRIAMNADGSLNLADANVNSLTLGNGTTADLTVNGIAVGDQLLSVSNLTKVANSNDQLISWDEKDSYHWSDSNSWNLVKTSVLVSTWVDKAGTYYGLIANKYNTDLKVGDNTDFYNNYLISKELEIYKSEEMVVLGFTFNAANKAIVIPDMVSIETETTNGTESSHVQYYPVREIWGANVYASVNGGAVHQLTINELAKPDTVDYVPAVFNAPYITKISLKRKLTGDTYSAFTGTFAASIHMPRLRKIVGAGYKFISPVFTSLNGTHNHITELTFPALEEIKYCIFGTNNNFVTEVNLPHLRKIFETVFCKSLGQIESIDLPRLWEVSGCDFFLANNYNLERVHMPTTVRFRPHELLNGPITIADSAGSFNNLIRSTLALLGINGLYPGAIRYNGTNSMSFFLHGDVKLMNVKQIGLNALEFNDLIDPEKAEVSLENGVMFDHANKYVGANYAIDRSGVVENLEQLYKRLKVPIESLKRDPAVKFVIGTAEHAKNYAIDDATKVVIDSNVAASTGVMVVPIDPRTALLNNTTVSTDRTTVVHSYTIDNDEVGSYHCINDPEFCQHNNIIAINYRAIAMDKFLMTCFGPNQFIYTE